MKQINAADCAKSMTIEVRLVGLRAFRVRLWLASILFRLGAFIAGFGLKLEAD